MEIDREFYSLSDLAQKWEMNKEQILHLATKGKLRLSVYWDGEYYIIKNGSRLKDATPILEDYIHLEPKHARNYLASLHKDDTTGIKVGEVATRDGRNVYLVSEHTWSHPIIPEDRVIILVEEVKKYEIQHPDIVRPHQSDKENIRRSTPAETKRQNTLLKIIGGLLKISYPKKCYTRENGSQNVSEIAKQFLLDLSKAGFNDTGMKDRTLRDVIPSAIEQIMENKEGKE
jgi:hypothetical protein